MAVVYSDPKFLIFKKNYKIRHNPQNQIQCHKVNYFDFCSVSLLNSTFHEIWLIAGTLDWDASFYRRASVVTFFIGFVFIYFFQYHGCSFPISNCHTQKVEPGSFFPSFPLVSPPVFPWFSPGFPLVLSRDR